MKQIFSRPGVLALLLFFGALLIAGEPQAVGDWEGRLQLPNGASLRIVFHIRSAADSTLTATMDSPDQGAAGIPVTKVTCNGRALLLEVGSIGGTFQGEFSGDLKTVSGVWMQAGQRFPLSLQRSSGSRKPARPSPQADKIVGTWLGHLKVPGGELRIVFNFSRGKNGDLQATLDSPDQGAKGIPVSQTEFDGRRLKLTVGAIGGEFEGRFSDDYRELTGTWRQSGQAFPLTLQPTEEIGEVNRPQQPQPPFPYVSKDIRFKNESAGIMLAGTLTLPLGGGPFPAAILISGSGPQDRDETIFNHRPFLVLADNLTRRGVAVLRFDDRGVGRSGGDFRGATSRDFAGDVRAAVAWLRRQEGIDPRKIGLIGHSEGALIAPLVAAEMPEVAFLVLLAAPGLPGDSLLNLQRNKIMQASNFVPALRRVNNLVGKKMLDVLKNVPEDSAALREIRAFVTDYWKKLSADLQSDLEKEGVTPNSLIVGFRQFLSPWARYFIQYDPLPALRQVRCPVLALWGEKDLQVPPRENLPNIEKALAEGGNRHCRLKVLPRLNHLFQTAKTGLPDEYGKIEETFSPLALREIGDWLDEIFR
ncbi:MAG: alpha/beta fold hydrolase [Calditrichia bacterium]